jgi:uncharacterized protein (TIGR00299 family) protein
MKVLYLDCSMGASGDMLMAALLELHPDRQGFIHRLNGLRISGVSVQVATVERYEILGTQVRVTIHGAEEESESDDKHHPHHHPHSDIPGIEWIVSHIDLSSRIRGDIRAVYDIIADAESFVHKKLVSMIHLHEVGMMDAVADIAGVCMLVDELGPDLMLASPVHVGCGTVRCAHGILPVPAPATARILQGIPMYGGAIQGELCTPTGAALLKYFCSGFIPMPSMQVQKTGCGFGMRDFGIPNCLRAKIGDLAGPLESV